jgi:hypothetical protein
MVQPLKKHRSDNVDRAATSGGSSSLIATPLRSRRTRHQYAIRLDQLQWLLGQMPGQGAERPDWITETAARNVVARWMKAGWVEAEQLRAHEPLWIWPTRKGLRKTNLPYNYRNIEQSGMDGLKHLYAINEIRLAHCEESNTRWGSLRQLLQEVQRAKGKDLLHRPDAVGYWPTGGVIAIEAELSTKITRDLAENLMELVRGEEYLQMRNEYGTRRARNMSHGVRSQFTEIWYARSSKGTQTGASGACSPGPKARSDGRRGGYHLHLLVSPGKNRGGGGIGRARGSEDI